MSLEEIEARLGTLVKAESISQLKSGVWKERLTGVLQCLWCYYLNLFTCR